MTGEIQFIANKIHELINSEVLIKDDKVDGGLRPIEFRDIVILRRSLKNYAAKILDVLRENNIPAYAADKEGYFKATEIQVILSLLTLLDNARQDIPLAAVLLSPIGGFSAEELAELRIEDLHSDMYELIEKSPSENCVIFLDKLNHWRELARQVSVPELLSSIYRETGYYDYVGKEMTQGIVRQANLRMLVDRAAEYEKTAFRGLSRFVQFIKKIRTLGNDLSSARTLGENENVVKVTTIHESKGLEFPVVFVAGLGNKFKLERDFLITHRTLGVGVFRVLADGAARLPNFARRVIERQINLESISEELRILYVALTRAKEKLILVGTVDNEKVLEKFEQYVELDELPKYLIQDAKKFMDWLLMIKAGAAKNIDTKIIKLSEIKKPTEITPAVEEEKKEEIFQKPEKLELSPLENIPAKLSVSELKRRAAESEFEEGEVENSTAFPVELRLRRPSFKQAKKISGSEYGTLLHSVMQHLNLQGELSSEGISSQISQMVKNELIDAENAKVIKIRDIEKFFAADIGKRLVASKKIYRELPFSRLISAKDFFKEAADEKIFIQGIIDLLFFDEQKESWILLDYKTDNTFKIPPDELDKTFRDKYKVQINLYVQAVESLLPIKIHEKYLYLLSANRLVEM